MGNLGMGEIFVILVLALLIFGPQRLPEIARNLGRAVRVFQQETQKAANVLRQAVEEEGTTRAGVIDAPDAAPRPRVEPDEPLPEPEVEPEPERRWEDT